jgi:hypothetical protein
MINKYEKKEIQISIFEELLYWIEYYYYNDPENIAQKVKLLIQEGIDEIQGNNSVNFKPYKKYIIKTMQKFITKVDKLV